MSRFSGRQFKGAERAKRMERRKEAEARQKKSDLRMAMIQALIPEQAQEALLGVVMPIAVADVEVETKEPAKRRRVRTKQKEAK